VEFCHTNIRRPATHYLGQRWYFVTACCDQRRSVFKDHALAIWLIEMLSTNSKSYKFAVHAYCLMPDHLHGLFFGEDETSHLLAFMKSLKQTTGYQFQKRFHLPLWQKKFYDYILRPGDSYGQVAAYIWMNPVRKGLCKEAAEYPYSGSFVVDWKAIVAPSEPWVPPWKETGPA
jgi:putative transposase